MNEWTITINIAADLPSTLDFTRKFFTVPRGSCPDAHVSYNICYWLC